MKKLIYGRPCQFLFVLTVAYAILAALAPVRLLIEIGDAFVIPMCAAAFWVYGKALLERDAAHPDHIDLLILGVFGGWLTNFADRTIRLLARMFDMSLLDTPVIGYLLLLLTFFAAIHVLVRGGTAKRGALFHEGWRTVIKALVAGVILATSIVVFHLMWDS